MRHRLLPAALLAVGAVLVPVRAWAVGPKLFRLEGHAGKVYSAEFRAAGKRILTYEGAGDARL